MTLTDDRFEINGTQYQVTKLGAFAGMKLFHYITRGLGDLLTKDQIKALLGAESSEIQADTELTSVLISMILRLPEDYVETIRKELFERVYFTNEQAQTPQKLNGAEDTAAQHFTDLEEVLVRALTVNFTDGFGNLVTRLGGELSSSLSRLSG